MGFLVKYCLRLLRWLQIAPGQHASAIYGQLYQLGTPMLRNVMEVDLLFRHKMQRMVSECRKQIFHATISMPPWVTLAYLTVYPRMKCEKCRKFASSEFFIERGYQIP